MEEKGRGRMIEVKLAGAVLAAVSAALLGFTRGNDLRRRTAFLQEFHKGLLILHQEMAYRKPQSERASFFLFAGDGDTAGKAARCSLFFCLGGDG